jgi:3-hydroxyisobutyrate dehydrogenase-like beta-hydroxyacid dehydrogenase
VNVRRFGVVGAGQMGQPMDRAQIAATERVNVRRLGVVGAGQMGQPMDRAQIAATERA